MADLVLTIRGQSVTLKPISDSAWSGELDGLKVTLCAPPNPISLMPGARQSGVFTLFLSGARGQHASAQGETPQAAADELAFKLAELRPFYRAWEFERDVEDARAELAAEVPGHA